jgi:hypothetical protein
MTIIITNWDVVWYGLGVLAGGSFVKGFADAMIEAIRKRRKQS